MNVTVDRNGKTHNFSIELKNDEGNTDISRVVNPLDRLGAKFAPISEERKSELGISSGLEVESVDSDGLFRKEGINKGFIILRINNTPVNNENDLNAIVASTQNRQDKVLLVAGFYPNGRTQYIAIDLSSE